MDYELELQSELHRGTPLNTCHTQILYVQQWGLLVVSGGDLRYSLIHPCRILDMHSSFKWNSSMTKTKRELRNMSLYGGIVLKLRNGGERRPYYWKIWRADFPNVTHVNTQTHTHTERSLSVYFSTVDSQRGRRSASSLDTIHSSLELHLFSAANYLQ